LNFISGNPQSDLWDLQLECDTVNDYAFPKIFGDGSYNVQIYGADVFAFDGQVSNPDFFMCGQVDYQYLPLNNFVKSGASSNGFIMSYNMNGKINWIQTGRHIYSNDNQLQSCYIEHAPASTFVYALMWRSVDSRMSVLAFDRDDGSIAQTLLLDG
jgi:hypothetical protein